MTKRFHTNINGEPAVCHAESDETCPRGQEGMPHGDSPEEVQQKFEDQNEDRESVGFTKKPAANVVAPNEFVSINDPGGFTALEEGEAHDLGRELEPGHYEGEYFDEESSEDVPVFVTVHEDGSTHVVKQPDDFSEREKFLSSSATSKRTERRKDAVDSVSQSLKNDARSREGDPKTLNDASEEIDRVSSKYDFTNPAEATRGFKQLDILQDDLNRRGHLADADGDDEAAHSWWKASEGLSDVLLKDYRR